MEFKLQLLEPTAEKKILAQLNGSGDRTQSVTFHINEAQVREIDDKHRYFGVTLGPCFARVPKDWGTRMTPFMLWHGDNHFVLEGKSPGGELIGPLAFDFALRCPGVPNSRFKHVKPVPGQSDMDLYTLDMEAIKEQEPWISLGPECVATVCCVSDARYSLRLVFQTTVREKDREPLMFFFNRVFALKKFALIGPIPHIPEPEAVPASASVPSESAASSPVAPDATPVPNPVVPQASKSEAPLKKPKKRRNRKHPKKV